MIFERLKNQERYQAYSEAPLNLQFTKKCQNPIKYYVSNVIVSQVKVDGNVKVIHLFV